MLTLPPRRALLIAIALACTPVGAAPPLPAAPAAPAAGDWPDERLPSGRRYRLVLPQGLDAGKPLQLVIALHGMGKDSKDVMPRYSGFNASAQRHELAVVYAQALPGGWGQRGRELQADLAYLDELLEALKARLPVDPRRVHLLGFSSGARLALRAAVERPGRYASLVCHSTLLPAPVGARMPPQLWVHGEKDRLVPIARVRAAVAAAVKARQRAELLAVPDLGHQWARQADINTRIWTFMALQTLATLS